MMRLLEIEKEIKPTRNVRVFNARTYETSVAYSSRSTREADITNRKQMLSLSLSRFLPREAMAQLIAPAGD